MDHDQLKRIADEVQGHLRLVADMRDTLELYTKRLVNTLLIRCNREDIPPALEVKAGEILEDMLRVDEVIPSASAGEKEVASITRGDTSISYRDKGGVLNNMRAFIKNYDADLAHFRKMNLPKG